MAQQTVDAYRVLSCESRVAILRVLEQHDGPRTVEQLSEAVGLHVNTVREHLDRLVAGGFVDRRPEVRTTRGRPRMLYRSLASDPTGGLDDAVRDQLVRVLLSGFGRAAAPCEDAAEAIGETWAAEYPCDDDADHASSASAQVAALHRHFTELGFDPELDEESMLLRLRRCPFGDLARQHGDVVCGVHVGLARGLLSRHGGPLTVRSIGPGTHGCVVALAVRSV